MYVCVFENFVSNYDSFIYVMQVYQNLVSLLCKNILFANTVFEIYIAF